jgi:hypothetical protein
MAFKGRMMSQKIMKDVPVVCLWCIWRACDAFGGACGFSGLYFSCIPFSWTTCQHLKALQSIHMHPNGLQRSYDVTTDHVWCACSVPVVHMTCLWCLWVFRIDFFLFSFFIDYISTLKSPSNHTYASEWPSKVVCCHYRSCMMCLWCACGAYDMPVMPVVVPVGFLVWLFFVFPFQWQRINV